LSKKLLGKGLWNQGRTDNLQAETIYSSKRNRPDRSSIREPTLQQQYLQRIAWEMKNGDNLISKIQRETGTDRHVVVTPMRELQRHAVRLTWFASHFKLKPLPAGRHTVSAKLTYCKHGDRHSVLKAVLSLQIGVDPNRSATREVAVVQPLEPSDLPQGAIIHRDWVGLPDSLKTCFRRLDNAPLQLVPVLSVEAIRFVAAPVLLEGGGFDGDRFYLLSLRNSVESDW
jgi:hypothetical protein